LGLSTLAVVDAQNDPEALGGFIFNRFLDNSAEENKANIDGKGADDQKGGSSAPKKKKVVLKEDPDAKEDEFEKKERLAREAKLAEKYDER
jgi:hypothetical protein